MRHTFDDPEAERRLICSQLCHMAVARGAEVSLQPASGELITPAVLSDSPEMEDVKLDWTRRPFRRFSTLHRSFLASPPPGTGEFLPMPYMCTKATS